MDSIDSKTAILQRKYYTYVLIDPRDMSVFYAGKGSGVRIRGHLVMAVSNRHYNAKLQNKILKILSMGLGVIAEKIFEHDEQWPCHANEVAVIAFYGRDNLCNLTDGGEGAFNPTPEERKRMSEERTGEKNHFYGKTHSVETRKKIGRPGESRPWGPGKSLKISGQGHHMFGKKLPLETKQKISVSLTGKKRSEESRAKQSATTKGRSLPPNHPSGMKGERNPHFGMKRSAETKEKIGNKNRGKIRTKEQRARISAGQSGLKHHGFGKPLSLETRQKISVSQKMAWRRKLDSENG